MARLKRFRSRILDKAAARAVGIASLDVNYACGPGSLAMLTQKIEEARAALESYNRLLAETDCAQHAFQGLEAEVNDLSVRLFAGVRGQFGKRSAEYLQVGGKPPPITRKRDKKRPGKG